MYLSQTRVHIFKDSDSSSVDLDSDSDSEPEDSDLDLMDLTTSLPSIVQIARVKNES